MKEHPLHHPNDRLFKSIFSTPANAAAFLRHHLPRGLGERIRPGSVSLENASFLDPSLSNLHSDLLLRVPFAASDAFLIVLLEHQSSTDHRMPLRLLGYIHRVLERFAKERFASLKLPPVFPLLISQADKPWSGPTQLHELINIPRGLESLLRPFQPQLQIHVLDLFTTSYAEFGGSPEGVLALRALKAKPVGALLSDDVWDASVLEHVSPDALTSFLLYTLDAVDDANAVIQRTKMFRSEAMHTASMSAAQKLIEQGRTEGISQGKSEGISEGIRTSLNRILDVRFGTLPEHLQLEINAVASEDRLMELLAEGVHCATLEDFQAHLKSPENR